MSISIDLDGRIAGFRLSVAFEVPSQGIVAIIGPSGSGKTSLLRALAGLERIAGTIRIDGEIWQDDRTFVPPERRRVGYVFQGGGLLPHLTVSANLDYAQRRAPPGPVEREQIVERAGIGHLLGRRPPTLSGGEAQRASMARALVAQPRLLLMDEPLAALDADARQSMLHWLETLLAELALPTFYVTHDEAEAARLAYRTIRLAGGRMAA